jgi:toxin ParE1/3/4
MKFKVILSPLALFDLEKIITYYQELNKNTSKKYYSNIMKNIKKLKDFPKIGRIVPETEDLFYDKYRELLYKNFRIIYRIDINEIKVIRILDGRMDIDADWFS